MPKNPNRRQFVRKAALASTFAFGIPVTAEWASNRAQAASGDEYGDLVGKLVYDGAPPERKKLKVDKDVDCCGKFDIRDETLMVGKKGGLANVRLLPRTARQGLS